MHATDLCDNTGKSCTAIHAEESRVVQIALEGSRVVQVGLEGSRVVQICQDWSRGV